VDNDETKDPARLEVLIENMPESFARDLNNFLHALKKACPEVKITSQLLTSTTKSRSKSEFTKNTYHTERCDK
jgi:hypothetical protein